MTLTVGQTLWYVPHMQAYRARAARGYKVTVAAVGRHWATLEPAQPGWRVDVKAMRVDGMGFESPGRCYLSEAAWRASLDFDDAWCALRWAVSVPRRRPEHLTMAQIENMTKMLRGGRHECYYGCSTRVYWVILDGRIWMLALDANKRRDGLSHGMEQRLRERLNDTRAEVVRRQRAAKKSEGDR